MKRNVEPQWGQGPDGKSLGNLGKYEIERPNPSGDQVRQMLELSEPAFSEIIGGAFTIKFSGPSVRAKVLERVEKELPRKFHMDGETKVWDEKVPDYLARTYQHARKIAPEVVKDLVFDPVAEFTHWKTEVFDKRGESDDRIALENFDGIVNTVKEKWDTASEAGRQGYITRLELKLPVTCTAQEFLDAMSKKYTRTTSKELDDLA